MDRLTCYHAGCPFLVEPGRKPDEPQDCAMHRAMRTEPLIFSRRFDQYSSGVVLPAPAPEGYVAQ